MLYVHIQVPWLLDPVRTYKEFRRLPYETESAIKLYIV